MTGRRAPNLSLAVLFVLLALAGLSPLRAVEPDERLADPAQETRARALSNGLRCLVCQNQSIDDSNAPLARDLRILLRERIAAGDDDATIKRDLVARYGDFILLQPPFNPRTLVLWSAPFVLLAVGGWVLFRRSRRQPALDKTPPLTEQERENLRLLLAQDRTNPPADPPHHPG
jgi:cytochrome c-type biogenesis protein CcmH